MTSVSKIVDKYNDAHYRKMLMKLVDVNSGTHVDFAVENNDKDPKFKCGDNATISNYSYYPYCPEKC